MSEKLISIITPCLNSGKHIERSIKSVFQQDYDNWEYVFIDGQSTDNTLEVIKKYSSSCEKIKWISEKDKGQSDAMNKGFQLCSGDIIVYLNADDYFDPNVFKTVIEQFEKTNCNIVFGNLRIFDAMQNKISFRKPSTEYKKILRYWENSFPANPVSYFIRRTVLKQYTFPISNHTTMDLEFLFYACKFHSITHINTTFGTFFLDGANKTSNMNIPKEQQKAYLNHCKKHEPLLYLKAILGIFKKRLWTKN